MKDYAEILFQGKCNLSCFFCIGKEMKNNENQLQTHYLEWKNFNKFIDKCKVENISLIYLSSTQTEPLLYKYLKELVIYLKKQGFKVGLRTNATLLNSVDILNLFNAEISLSIQGLDNEIVKTITGRKNVVSLETILQKTKNRLRISVVVNSYNVKEIPQILEIINKNKEYVDYVQLRRIYSEYENKSYDKHRTAFDDISNWVKKLEKIGNYYESDIYKYKDISVSLWKSVFKKESLDTLNYFTSGVITDDNLLIRGYNNKGVNNGNKR